MSQTIELPDPLFASLKEAAEANGTTPVGWIAAKLSDAGRKEEPVPVGGTLADLFTGRIGKVRSGGGERLSEDCGAKFTEHLNEKRSAGHL